MIVIFFFQTSLNEMQINGKDEDSHFTNGYLHGLGRFSCPVSSPEAYACLLENPQLFYQKLNEFHESFGLTLVSSAASSVLDLYLFFKEVTLRGGFAQVTKDGRWFEVASALNFSNCSPQTSLLLQNIYANLLFQFELIYGSMPPGSQLESAPIKRTSLDHPSSSGDNPSVKRVHPSSPNQFYKASDDPGNQVGKQVYGVIENEIECGYLVSVMVGMEKLNGLLYHITDSDVEQFAVLPSLMDGVGMEDSDSEPVGLQVLIRSTDQELATMLPSAIDESIIKPTFRSRSKDESKIKRTVGLMSIDKVNDAPTVKPKTKKERMVKEEAAKSTSKKEGKDKEAPLRTRSAYQFFLCKECNRLRKQHGKNSSMNIRQMALDTWKCLSESDRLPYIEESKKDKERFNQEMIAYNERKAMKSSAAEFRIFDSDASMREFHNDYQMEQTEKLFRQDGSMVGFAAARLTDSAFELDAALQIKLDDEFPSET